jgi:hypothetical protein
MSAPLGPGEAVVSYGYLGTVKDVRPHDPRKPYLVTLPVGSVWTKHVMRPPLTCACDGEAALYKTRQDRSTGLPLTPGVKGYDPRDPAVLAYAEALGHEDPYLYQRIQDQLTRINETEWRDPERYFQGLTPAQLEAQHRDPHLMLLGALAQQMRPAAESFRLPHELVAQGVDLSPRTLASTPPERIAPFIRGGIQNVVARHWHAYANHLMRHYGGDARAMWADDPDYTTLRNRLSELPAASDYKKVPMLIDILRRWGPEHGGISGRGFAGRSHPILDTHAIRMYSHMMTSDPDRRAWLDWHSQGGGIPLAIPYFYAFTHAVGDDPNLNHAPFWQLAQQYCKPAQRGGPQCQGCPVGASCATGMLRPEHREALERYRGDAERLIPRLSDERASEAQRRQRQPAGVS